MMSSYIDETKQARSSRKFNKFETERTLSSEIAVEENFSDGSVNNRKKQIGDYHKPKMINLNHFSPAPLKKNLANNRMQRLRDNLKTDLNLKQKATLITQQIEYTPNTGSHSVYKSNIEASNRHPYNEFKIPRSTKTDAGQEFSKDSHVLIEDSSNLEPHLSPLTKSFIAKGSKRNISSVSDVFDSTPECSLPKKFALDANRTSANPSSLNSYDPKYDKYINVSSNFKQNQNDMQSRVPTFDKTPIKLKVANDFINDNNSNISQTSTPFARSLSRTKRITQNFVDPCSNVPAALKKIDEDRNTRLSDDFVSTDYFSEPKHLSPLLNRSLDKRNISDVYNSSNSPPKNYKIHLTEELIKSCKSESVSDTCDNSSENNCFKTNRNFVLNDVLSSNIDTKNTGKLETSKECIPKKKLKNSSVDSIGKINSLKTCSGIPVSQRLSQIKHSITENKNNSTYTNENKATFCDTDPYENNPKYSNFKPYNNPDPVQFCSTIPSTVYNHDTKLEMTSSWVRNLQNTNDQLPQNVNDQLPQNAKDQLPQNAPLPADSDSADEMEWTNAESDPDIDSKDEIENLPDSIEKVPEKSKDLCIVVDTNVFISALSKVKDILNIRLTGDIKPILFIPWMVITELDYMKDSTSNKKLQSNISDSVKFINNALKEKHPQVKCQTVLEVDKQKQLGSSPDDKIISCCMQVAEHYESVILLSNDLNLKNRVMINGISAASSQDILVKLMSKLAITVKSQKVMQKMSILCSSIICECTKEVYGIAWSKMDMLSCPPWSLAECLKRFKKYWRSVFKDKLMKQITKVLEDLALFLANNKFVPDDSEEYVKFMKLCITLCIFLKDIEESRCTVKNTLNEITKLG